MGPSWRARQWSRPRRWSGAKPAGRHSGIGSESRHRRPIWVAANASLPCTQENAPMNLRQYARTLFAIVAVVRPPRRGRRRLDRRPGEWQSHGPRLGRLRCGGFLDRLQEGQSRRRRDVRDRRVRRRHPGQDDGWQPGRRLPPLHRLAAVLCRRRAGRGDRHLPPDELGQGAGPVQGAWAVRRQAVFHPLRLGLQLDPLPDRSGAGRGRILERDVRSEVLRPHLDVG